MKDAAKTFAQAKDTIEKLERALKQAYEPLRGGGWIGREGANKYFQEQESMTFPEIDRLKKALGTASSKTLRIAKIFEDKQNEAASALVQGME
jgi:WXG100 family type VII secretion target